ncbi:MAG: phenylalanine--tRNA ligase subunit alpha [Acidimicrobiia bacterium]|nr:phenylalanine--tRNA ligase subunit alpha [Acidimicrobiia bacterium]
MNAEDVDRAASEAVASVRAADDLESLAAVEAALGAKSAPLNAAKRSLGALEPDQRKELGRRLNEARAEVATAVETRRSELAAAARAELLEAERLDLTESPGGRAGHLHLVTQARDELEDVFVGMGFTVAEGPEVETDWYNFEALNLPPAHPARGMWDTLYLDSGEPGTVLLRTHTSPVQIRVMSESEPPIYSVMPGRVYRRDTADASHTPVFHQIEGLVVDRGISFADLAGTLEAFTTTYFGRSIHSRLRPSYFPFTEPSAEFDITCVFCGGDGCRSCGGTGWLELGGCGMVHPNVFAAVGYDPEEWTGFAFGFGIDRMTAQRNGVDDLRELFTNDIRFLEQF